MNTQEIFLHYGYLDFKFSDQENTPNSVHLGTVVSNLAYFGYMPSADMIQLMLKCDNSELEALWNYISPTLSKVSGNDRSMNELVVYTNFPDEVLSKSRSEYWVSQILMYWGLPNHFFQEATKPREASFEDHDFRILNLAQKDTLENIQSELMKSTSRWSDNQIEFAKTLFEITKSDRLNFNDFNFKGNAVLLASQLYYNNNKNIIFSNPKDVLRFAGYLSDQVSDLRVIKNFSNFKRKDRKFLVESLNHFNEELLDEVTKNVKLWKNFFRKVHPGDYTKATNVIAAYSSLYNKTYTTDNSSVEFLIKQKDKAIFEHMKQRPGDFARRLHKLYSVFGNVAFEEFSSIAPQLQTSTLVKLKSYFQTANTRSNFIYAPNGDWSNAKISVNNKSIVHPNDVEYLFENIETIVKERLLKMNPEGFNVSESSKAVKLQGNNQKLAAYGRGTEFIIPDNVKFIRTASFWKHKAQTHQNTWFDNGFNFFDSDWDSLNAICWNNEIALNKAAVFSGDPTNSKDLEGRGCQMIDLYPDKLLKAGVRYAVWSVLCYSGVRFSEADEVLATLQWGEEPQKNKLYEPSRAQMVFPIKDTALTKYVAYIDLVERKLIYMDANLPSSIQSALFNSAKLTKYMPAYQEYINSQPSYYDLFSPANGGDIPIIENDKDKTINGKAYVFRKLNENSIIEDLKIQEYLEDKTMVNLQSNPALTR